MPRRARTPKAHAKRNGLVLCCAKRFGSAMRPRIAFAADISGLFPSPPGTTRFAGKIGGRFLGMAAKIRAILTRRRQSDGATGRDA
jgi:hypothetical protein